MKPVDQLICSLQIGDCFRACVASILEMEINSVPNFMEKGDDGWIKLIHDFFDPMGIHLLEIGVHDTDELNKEMLRETWTIGSGLSPRAKNGEHHAIVCYEGKMIHDPHPSKAGVEKVDKHTIFVIKNKTIQ